MISVLNSDCLSDAGNQSDTKLCWKKTSGWSKVYLKSGQMFQSNVSYMVRLALTDQYCSASPVWSTRDACKGLLFELPSEYTYNSQESCHQTRAYGVISYNSKNQWHCVELEDNGRMRVSTTPEQASSDDMTLGWRVLFEVGAIVESRDARVQQLVASCRHSDRRDVPLFQLS
ncbi:uncharacterized protein LOC134184971 [Corticium candelabrum]|uniref:uncharacterized protein LOC134184971 n=1 Tax=Corticium candelabrum TaxID=121492 RepID=UPI002E2F7389|nr:uncharacterized protein LOC134184971 [Corticium candelabrum]